MDSEIILPPDYKPSADEEYMNEYQVEYFRQKLLSWKKSLLEQSKDTLEDLRQGGLNQPDQLDRWKLRKRWICVPKTAPASLFPRSTKP